MTRARGRVFGLTALGATFVLTFGSAAGPPSPPPPLAPWLAARSMEVPEGFRVTAFAAEPDVRQPIAVTTDPRGRLWVAENFSYPGWLQPAKEPDRILILEDVDGDGTMDRRKVFWDKGKAVTGLAVGFGGVWVCATPDLLFIPDRDGDDVPDGPPTVVLDGWDVKAQHNLFNALTWGPDGWLYGCNGILSNSRVGRPGTPDERRVPINCGVWRYHPTRQVFEAVAHGTTNPWGLDFDDLGEMFFTNCVIPHLFHVVPGARFVRMFGQDFNPHSYELMPTCADHIHWSGSEAWSDIRSLGVSSTTDRAGGGHAHTGCMIYLGDNWPDRYRQTVFTCNIHGHRVNNDRIEPHGSGYVARHAADFLRSGDPWFRGMELRYGPDGGVFLTDWSDVGECHDTDGDLAHRETGRIFKITYGDVKPVKVDLAALDDEALARLQSHKNDWHVRQARRLLQERAAAGRDVSAAHKVLRAMFQGETAAPRQLRALWALHVSGGLTPADRLAALGHASEHVRAWGVRLLCEDKDPGDDALRAFERMARDDPSDKAALALASALQRVPEARRWGLASALAARPEARFDRPLTLMTWYGIEPLVGADPSRGVGLASACHEPTPRRFIARRATAAPGGGAALVRLLGDRDDPGLRRDVLAGMDDALRGLKRAEPPEGWDALADRLVRDEDPGVRRLARALALRFGDPRAVGWLTAAMADPSAPADERRDALRALTEHRAPGLAARLHRLLDDPALRPDALRALAAVDDPATPAAVLGRYKTFSGAERADAVNTLAARPAFARALLDAIRRGEVSPRDLPVTAARQIAALKDPALTSALESVWGTLRPTSRETAALTARYKARLTPERLARADPARGRLVFQNTCASCHKLYGEGGDLGPELTGSDRANLDYVLGNVLDPSATVARDYKLTTVATRDGRILSGLIRDQNDRSVVVQTVNDRVTLDRDDIEEVKTSDASVMPEGLFQKLSDDEVADLVAYLASRSQIPLPSRAR